jgi:type III pantothenate kinase
MNSIVTIDNGNSNPHFRIYEDGKASSPKPLVELQKENAIYIISQVGKNNSTLDSLESKLISFNKFRLANSFLSMPVSYSKSLGVDRLYQAYYLYKNSKLPQILIDAGTFITIDLITKNGFEGGFIFPGEKTFLESYSKGANLPTLTLDQLNWQNKDEIPVTTEEAILVACKNYLRNTYKDIIEKHRDVSIALTGGNCQKHATLIQDIFPESEIEITPHLIHDSLYEIYCETKNHPQYQTQA